MQVWQQHNIWVLKIDIKDFGYEGESEQKERCTNRKKGEKKCLKICVCGGWMTHI